MQAYVDAEWRVRRTLGKFPAMAEPDREPTGVAEVAARLQLTREALKLSQAELCRRTGISTQAWNNAETADNRIAIDEAIKLCRYSGVTLDWIYRGVRAFLPATIVEEIMRREGSSSRRQARRPSAYSAPK